MTGKQFKSAVSIIPDDAEVDIHIVEKNESSFYPSDIITKMTIQNTTQFSPISIFSDKRISIVCFDINGGDEDGHSQK